MARRNRLPPYLAIAADLKAKIDSGELPEGEQVPPVPEICEQYKVSRGTALRVLKVLRDDGYAESQPGWGTFVKKR
jgi:GntR family transcriptional regulator